MLGDVAGILEQLFCCNSTRTVGESGGRRVKEIMAQSSELRDRVSACLLESFCLCPQRLYARKVGLVLGDCSVSFASEGA